MKWRVVMLRKLAVFIVSAGLTMSPLSVQALGFGGIKLKSSLNEKLNAEIALISASANDVQSLTINLATEEAFLRSGIDRTALLNTLKFKVKKNASGDYYIHVTTATTVREPFMNFLLDLNWKNGRMLREYTMLIDPPHSQNTPTQFSDLAPDVAEIMNLKPRARSFGEQPVAITETSAAEDSSPFIDPIVEASPLAEFVPGKSTKYPTEAAALTEMVSVDEFSSTGEVTEAQVFSDDAVWPRLPFAALSGDEDATATSELGDLDYGVVARENSREEDSAPAIAEDSVATAELGDLDYGITKAKDNLWSIAEKLRQGDKSVSVYQVMMALLQSNPGAFVNNNVHRLKVGHVLRINDPAVLTSISRKEAANSYIAQTGRWDRYRHKVAKATNVQPIRASGGVAKTKVATTDTKGKLTLSSPDGESLTAGGGANEESLNNDLATMQDQLRQAKSDAGTMRTRNVALNDKLQSLEDELNRLQRSLSVKDDELAALQQQFSSLNQKPAEPLVQEQPAAKDVPAVTEKIAKPKITKPVVKQVKPKTPKQVTAKVEAVTEPEVTNTEQGIMDTTMEVITNTVQSIKDTVMGFITSLEVTKTVQSIKDTVMGFITSLDITKTVQGIMEFITPFIATVTGILTDLNLGSDTLIYVAAPILLVLLIIVLVVIKRIIKRPRQGDFFQESILTGAATAKSAGGDSTTLPEESSFLSDFAMSDSGGIDADDSEVDPLTEADVFMAYGRYEAAEERLTEAVQNDPTRMELRTKLLELYHATQNKAAFEAAAEDFYASLGGNEAGNPLWEKIVGMGTEIAPENPLFNQGGGGDISAASNAGGMDELDLGLGMADSQVMDIGLDADVTATEESVADMDFNLDIGGDTATDEPATDMDFNLDIGGDSTTEESVADMDFSLDIGGDSATEEPAADMDFNLDIGGDSATEESAADMDFNLDIGGDSATEEPAADMDFNLDIGGDSATEEPAVDMDFNLDIGGDSATEEPATDMDFNLDIGGDSATEEPAADMDFNLDIGGDTATEEPATDMDFNLDVGMTESADDGGLDFNLDMGTDDAEEESLADLDLSMDMETSESADDGGLDFALDIGDDDSADGGLVFDAGSFDLNLDASDTADADFGGGDEVGTKLDLAKAYIDMGDPEGARSILDEVMGEGSGKQIEEAQTLLGQIA